jgi:hypothetical protein
VAAEAEHGHRNEGSGGFEPKAMRVRSRILVVTDSVRPLDKPCSIAARIDGVCATMLFCSLTNAGMRHRRAQLTQRTIASRASWSGIWKISRRPSLSW